jgi:hypothetical protein
MKAVLMAVVEKTAIHSLISIRHRVRTRIMYRLTLIRLRTRRITATRTLPKLKRIGISKIAVLIRVLTMSLYSRVQITM